MSKIDLSVEVRDDLIVVMQHSPEFVAVYAMAPDEPSLNYKAAQRRMTRPSWRKLGSRRTKRRGSWVGLSDSLGRLFRFRQSWEH
jgi:hypothetical protein